MPVPAGAWLYSHKTGRIEMSEMTDADRITALEAEVVSLRATEARLKGLLKAIHAGITMLGEGIPFNYGTWEWLEKEVSDV